MLIRKAVPNEIDSIMKIYEIARCYMADNGNATQWGTTYPPQDLIEEDIRKEHCYVGVCDDGIHCVFALIEGEDPTYLQINGAWLNDKPYSTIHRIASDGKYHGIFKECIDFCKKKSHNLRIDTHENNAAMHHLIQKNGFIRCGIIHLKNGAPRVAYQFTDPTEL